MRGRRSLVIVLEGRNMLVRGPGSRELLMTVCNGKPPFRSRAANAWTVQAKRLADVLALADRLGYDVRVHEVQVGDLRNAGPHSAGTAPRCAAATPSTTGTPGWSAPIGADQIRCAGCRELHQGEVGAMAAPQPFTTDTPNRSGVQPSGRVEALDGDHPDIERGWLW